jgi:hypothetical protein
MAIHQDDGIRPAERLARTVFEILNVVSKDHDEEVRLDIL